MAKQRAPLEFNQLSGGLITEASALTFPDSASLDEDNFELSRKGSRRRRYGIEYESGYGLIDTPSVAYEDVVWNTFLWKNVAGYSSKEVLVVQVNNVLHLLPVDGDTISNSDTLLTITLTTEDGTKAWDFTHINGDLVAATGSGSIITVTAELDGSELVDVEISTERLTIRDLVGVDAYYNLDGTTVNLTEQDYLIKRPDPEELDSQYAHIYNLRNQSFAIKRRGKASSSSATDPIELFKTSADGLYPANADAVTSALYPNTSASNATVDRFHSDDLVDNQQGSYGAAKGYFVIDALDREVSRIEKWDILVDEQGYESNEVGKLQADLTPGGATCLAEYSGRVWYGGFSEEGSDTSTNTLILESYLLYSQSSNDASSYTKCYQAGDPTSLEDPELIDTDGGFLSLDGAYGIHKMIPVGNSLIVFASNGVWGVSGADGNYFAPTTPRVVKISDRGSVSSKAIISVGSTVAYWAKDGIYHINVTGAETYEANNLTESTIQTLYNEISYISKTKVSGRYDEYTSEISWVINNTVDRSDNTFILKMLTTSGAFTVHTIYDGDTDRTVAGPVEVPAFYLTTSTDNVTVDGEVVTVDEEDVYIETSVESDTQKSTKYLTFVNEGGELKLTFSVFSNPDFLDWGEVDSPGYMVTGYVSGGDFQRQKQIPYITFHFDRTEDGFELNEDGDIQPTNQSSCYVQAQWEWADSATSGRWGRTFQAYRYKRMYMPADVDDAYDYGFSTIVTRNKIRGSGKVLSLKLSTEEGKDCRLLGWSAVMGVNSNV